MPKALLSVSDKRNLEPFARDLVALGWEILSTGGTAKSLRDAGIPVTDVSTVTQHPEMMDGRVKTLHPAIHGGLLARRDVDTDMAALGEQGYAPIDLVAVNLYPFHEAVAAGVDLDKAMEKVDIGGPGMLRSAAKNHAGVLVIVDPDDYARVIDAVRNNSTTLELRRELAGKVFDHTARYDRAIADYFARKAQTADTPAGDSSATPFPAQSTIVLRKVQDLRYGENPDQPAAFYGADESRRGLAALRQLQGKELSFNNILDIDAGVFAASAWAGDALSACVIVKHTTPCGVAVGATPLAAYERALACDPVSAFGGVVAFTHRIDADIASAMAATFYEIVIAPAFTDAALEIFARKKNLRVIVMPVEVSRQLDARSVDGGWLIQQRMLMEFPELDWRVASIRRPTEQEMNDLRFAWRACAAVKSNAIVLARDGGTLGIGAGQMSRVDSSRIAVLKAADRDVDLNGAALASDAFFPFRDGVDAAANAGITAIIQPGGSVRDEEVIAAANEHNIAMIFTGRRLFRH